jgi:hypothetical protein
MENLSSAKKMDILLCADTSTARHQHEVEACTVCGITGPAEKNYRTVTNLTALN